MDNDKQRYWLLSGPSGIEQTQNPALQRHFAPARIFSWLKAGWRDVTTYPFPSLFYGVLVFTVSALMIYSFIAFNLDYVLFPALSGFLIFAPLLAMGLYRKSAKLSAGEAVTLGDLLGVKAHSGGGQVFFVGLLLTLLVLVWMRAAVLVYALFFGYRPFGGMAEFLPLIFSTPAGWSMLVVGVAVGGLFAAFGFAVSAFSIPMLMEQKTDALSAMGTSMALVWNNLWVSIAWGLAVLCLVAASMLTGLLGLIIIFPWLGHATWHAYRDMAP